MYNADLTLYIIAFYQVKNKEIVEISQCLLLLSMFNHIRLVLTS